MEIKTIPHLPICPICNRVVMLKFEPIPDGAQEDLTIYIFSGWECVVCGAFQITKEFDDLEDWERTWQFTPWDTRNSQ